MPVQSRVHILLAQYNLERAQRGEEPFSIKRLAEETNIAASSLQNFVRNRTTRVDFGTIYKLMKFFNVSDMNLILALVDEEEPQAARSSDAAKQDTVSPAESARTANDAPSTPFSNQQDEQVGT